MAKPILSRKAWAVMLSALAEGLRTGSLVVYDGNRPASVELPAAPANRKLVQFQLQDSSATIAKNEMSFAGNMQGVIKRSGSPMWFRLYASNGDAIMDGDVGPDGDLAFPDPVTKGGTIVFEELTFRGALG
jgi:hypothetical protein